MEGQTVIKQNLLTKKPQYQAWNLMILMAALMVLGKFGGDWMPATANLVFKEHQWWRLWTALFAHADLGHLLSNSMLFVPLSFLLPGYYGYGLFPVLGIFMGGLVNAVVLTTLPPDVYLLGMSGVVYWMGAVWLTLFMLVDRRRNWRYRFAHVLFLFMMLFVPETYKPEVSYLSHFLGFMMGVFCATGFYLLNHNKINAHEITEFVPEEPFEISQN